MNIHYRVFHVAGHEFEECHHILELTAPGHRGELPIMDHPTGKESRWGWVKKSIKGALEGWKLPEPSEFNTDFSCVVCHSKD